jgi:hypothetical protein
MKMMKAAQGLQATHVQALRYNGHGGEVSAGHMLRGASFCSELPVRALTAEARSGALEPQTTTHLDVLARELQGLRVERGGKVQVDEAADAQLVRGEVDEVLPDVEGVDVAAAESKRAETRGICWVSTQTGCARLCARHEQSATLDRLAAARGPEANSGRLRLRQSAGSPEGFATAQTHSVLNTLPSRFLGTSHHLRRLSEVTARAPRKAGAGVEVRRGQPGRRTSENIQLEAAHATLV